MDDLAVPPAQILAPLTRVLCASELLFQELDVLEGLLLCFGQLSPSILRLDLSLGIGDHLEVRLVGGRSLIEVMLSIAAILVGVIEFPVFLIEVLRRDVLGSPDVTICGIGPLSRTAPLQLGECLPHRPDVLAEYLECPLDVLHAFLDPAAAVVDL
jgi:hypothetical protein